MQSSKSKSSCSEVRERERERERERDSIFQELAMQHKLIDGEKESQFLPAKKDQGLRRVFSDASAIVPGLIVSEMTHDQEELVECECCGMSEDCTPTYISRIKALFCGKWICGLCAEAVKEKMRRDPSLAMEEALESHESLCKQFNRTTRLNPKLSLAGAMRDIARKSSQRRSSSADQCGLSNIGRTMSCVPRIDGC